MTDVRILDGHVDRERARFDVPGLDPGDATALLLILGREAQVRRLGNPDDLRIQAWDHRRGWREYRRTVF